jgi:hypothetical protein
MRTFRRALALSSALLLAVAPARAQGPSGTLNGHVVDQSGAAVPGVTVTATNPATSEARVAVTGPDGFYHLTALPLGVYEVTHQPDGFKTVTRDGVLVEAAVPRRVSVRLEVGGLSEVVRVEAGSPTLNTATPDDIFTLRNTRTLDDPFLSITNDQFGIGNPALEFDDRDATRRLGHFVNRAITWSIGGPNDSFNRREQQTLHLSEALTWMRGAHTIQIGGDVKRHTVRTNLPEEQATEFEKIENFQATRRGIFCAAQARSGWI